MKFYYSIVLFLVFAFSAVAHTKDTLINSQNLKRGYRLAYWRNDSIQWLAIEKGNSSIELGEGEADAKMPVETLGYLYADFDKYFAIATHLGPTPIKISIYDKKTGGLLYYGVTPFYLDTIRGLLMYEGAYGKAGKLILFDATLAAVELYDAPTDTPCFGFCCWKVEGITDKEVKIEYINMKGQSVTKVYNRKPLPR